MGWDERDKQERQKETIKMAGLVLGLWSARLIYRMKRVKIKWKSQKPKHNEKLVSGPNKERPVKSGLVSVARIKGCDGSAQRVNMQTRKQATKEQNRVTSRQDLDEKTGRCTGLTSGGCACRACLKGAGT